MSIFLAVVIVSAIGLIAGLGLAVASIVMAVPVDEKAEEIEAVLPGANCGAADFQAAQDMPKLFQRERQRKQLFVLPAATK